MILTAVLAAHLVLGNLALPRLEPASIESMGKLVASQAMAPDKTQLSILFSNLTVTSRTKFLCNGCNARAIRVTVPIQVHATTTMKVLARGAIISDDARRASCVVWVNGIAQIVTDETEFVLTALQTVRDDDTSATITVALSCASSSKSSQSEAAVDSLDISSETQVPAV